MRNFIKILLFLFCAGCNNSGAIETEYETNLSKANVSKITERLQVMIALKENSFHESRKLITDTVAGYIEKQIIYDENGKATLFYTGASEGLIKYSLHPKKNHLPFSISPEYYLYACKIIENRIIDIAEPKPGRIGDWRGIDFVADTIRDFVIIPKDKIILSKDDYKLLQKAKNRDEFGARYILYRYE